jgi:glycerol-3-phosphate dehydrogenase (NAD(P)+)
LAAIADKTRLILLAVPSSVVRPQARELGDHIDGRHLVVHGVRGLADGTMHTVSEVVRQETPTRRVGALGGPVLASELLEGKPSVMVAGSAFPEVNDAVVEAFGSDTVRVYTTHDLLGLEWCSALAGCLAIGVGFATELGLGPGLVAAVMTRAVGEASRIVEAAGGQAATMLGLSGYGDLLACLSQRERPEVRLGAALAKGVGLDSAIREARLRVEAVELVPRLVRWAVEQKVRVPIFSALSKGLFAGTPTDQLIHELMTADRVGAA